VIRGWVQGVGYRNFTQRVADRLGVRGFVRNLPSGEVEVQAEADDATLQLFKQELRRGPRMAQVDEILESDIELSASYSSFSIRG
jgi:acylphosphatase